MKKYLIRIENNRGGTLYTTVHGDTPSRPFSIANNLWNYETPWTAARRLELLARSWMAFGLEVTRIYGAVSDMPTAGNENNVAMTLNYFK